MNVLAFIQINKNQKFDPLTHGYNISLCVFAVVTNYFYESDSNLNKP